ncbi:hypothetical protein QJS10_CPB12g00455 [Acorus calamus]|uniref:Uncharacterized protein n=1 Tax=Acorus calamus TaxID=4465 RepID=A0AAV9DKY7_ACOCL|nr:hypothetical protein QJS10_CPB12g00455 [Acorus calamus]
MVMETGSSFGSASSGPSLSNLPPVRVRSDGVDDRSPPAAAQVGVEEYFAQMGLQRAEDHPPPPPPPLMVVGGAPASVSPVENPNRVSSDDERSVDHGVARKAIPPQPIAPPPQQQKLGNLDLPSPDPSINGPGFYQDQVTSVVSKERTSPAATATPINTIPDPRREVRSDPYLIPTQLQDPNYGLPIQPEKQQPPPPLPQFVHTGHPHYMPHHATGHIPMASYYQPIHPQHQQQQQQQQHFEQSTYPVYYVPYNLAMPPNLGEIPPTQATMASYKEPLYPPRPIPPKPEMGSNLYRTAAAAAAAAQPPPPTGQMMQAEADRQFFGYHHQLQNMSHYVDPLHGQQIYYTQPTSTTLLPQYQTVTSATMMSEATIASQPSDPKQSRGST